MRKLNLDQIELAPYRDLDAIESGEKIPSRWELCPEMPTFPGGLESRLWVKI